MKIAFMAAVALLCLLGVASAMSSPSYILNWSVMGGGGGSSGSTNFVMGGTIGQNTGQTSGRYSLPGAVWFLVFLALQLSPTDRTRLACSGMAGWYLDYNGDGIFSQGVDRVYGFGAPGGSPVVGDWTGTGTSRIGVIRNNSTWILDASGDGKFGAGDLMYTFGERRGTYITGDWTGPGYYQDRCCQE